MHLLQCIRITTVNIICCSNTHIFFIKILVLMILCAESIILGKAKVVCNFGLSGCNNFKKSHKFTLENKKSDS